MTWPSRLMAGMARRVVAVIAAFAAPATSAPLAELGTHVPHVACQEPFAGCLALEEPGLGGAKR